MPVKVHCIHHGKLVYKAGCKGTDDRRKQGSAAGGNFCEYISQVNVGIILQTPKSTEQNLKKEMIVYLIP